MPHRDVPASARSRASRAGRSLPLAVVFALVPGSFGCDDTRPPSVQVPRDGGPTCVPASTDCDGDRFLRCDAEGTAWVEEAVCDATLGERCSERGCADLCRVAAATKSYVGCEYWAVPLLNDASLLPDPSASPPWAGFDFAVVLANTNLVPAVVTVDHPSVPAPITVARGAIEVVRLPWVDGLQFGREPQATAWRSRLVEGAATRITSDVPVTVYQFDPLDYATTTDGGVRYSYTNDASLLLPVHALTGEYRAVTLPTRLLERPFAPDPEAPPDVARNAAPGFVAIVATAEGPTAVELRASGHVAGTADDRLAPLAPGEVATVTLARGDVLELVSGLPEDCPGDAWVREPTDSTGLFRYCRVGSGYDLTGLEVRADAPVAVIAGHQCAFVPFDRFACDHLEESQFPIQSWDREVLVAAPRPIREEPFVVRVLSATDDNAVRFEPAVVPPVRLDAGQVFTFESEQDLFVLADEPVAVATFLVGQDYFGLGSSGAFGEGDPSMSLGIPRAQLRDRYAFLSPPSFTSSFITVLARPSASLTLDGRPLERVGARPVGSSGFVSSSHEVGGGAHRLDSDELIGLVVYGYAEYTSYMVPGGLDFEDLGILR